MYVSGPEQHLNTVLHSCWTCDSTLVPTSFQAALEVQRCSQIFQIFPPLSADTQARQLPSVRSASAGARLTSAECRNACHRRSKTLTISEFTSAQAQGVSAVRQTTQQLGHQGQRHRGGRKRAKEGLREKKKWEGGKECGYLLSDGPAEMCWDDTSFYIRCAHSLVKPHVPSALLRYCSLLHMCVCSPVSCSPSSGKSVLQASVASSFLHAEWWQCPVGRSNTELTPQAYFQLRIFQQPLAWVIWVVVTWQSNWFAQITPRIWQPAPFTDWALRSSCL